MTAPGHPERHVTLAREVGAQLQTALEERRSELATSPVGSDSRFGPERVVANILRLYPELQRGKRVESVQDIARILGVRRTEAASVLALESGPLQPRLNPLASGLVRGTTKQTYEFAPEKPQAIVLSSPSSPAPGVHRSGKRTAEKGNTFGVAVDGTQRFQTVYLSASYGVQDEQGYSAALGGLLRPSSADDERSCLAVDRTLAFEHPATYARRVMEQIVAEVDDAHPEASELPIFLMDGRRDCHPSEGITLSPDLDALAEDPDWGQLASLPGDRVKMVEVSDPGRLGGGGLNRRLRYVSSAPGRRELTGAQVEDGLMRRDPAAAEALVDEWEILPPIDAEMDGEESTSILVFKGFLLDPRTRWRSRLLVFDSITGGLPFFAAVPFGPGEDPFPHLPESGRHPRAERQISLTARLLAGPSLWTGPCRRNAYLYTDFFYVAAKECPVRENAFHLGVNLRMGDVDYPCDADGELAPTPA